MRGIKIYMSSKGEIMKKYIQILCLLMAFAFILQGCGKDKNKDTETESSSGTSASTSQTSDSPELSSSKSEKVVIGSINSDTTDESSQDTSQSSSAASSTSSSSKSTRNTSASGADNPAPAQSNIAGVSYVNGVLIANKTYSLPSTYNPGVDPTAQNAFSTMAADAAKQGINLFIVSGFRSYSTQASIYNNYVAQDGKAEADRYSARPGHSEHQTGLAFDLNSLSQSFENTAEGKWLAANCYKYGFIIRYPKGKENITGYMYEPWHVRYLGTETATAVYNSGKTLEEYLGVNSVYAD